MSDNRELDEVMKHIKLTLNQAAKEKARAVFLQKIDESMESGKENKQMFWKNKRLLYSFASGMAVMLILVVGLMSAVNPEFLSGTVRTADYYEINSPYAPFENGDVISADTIREMKASDNKFKLYLENGLALYLDSMGDGAVTLQYDLMADPVLAELFGSGAGGSIVTLKVESGFTEMPVKYEIDLTCGVLEGMYAAEQQKWLSGFYVYCYIVDRDQLNRYIETGSSAAAIVSREQMLPAKIDGKTLHINTDPSLFDADKDMLMFTLQELDTDYLINTYTFKGNGAAAGIGGGNEGSAGTIEIQ